MAVVGVPPLLFAVVALIDLLYQYWIHTQQVGRLGWFDRVFASPSNHRVHHAVNDAYLDRNYGGILILWDRLFGTFADEQASEPCVYGTRKPLRSWDPLWANLEVYGALARDCWRTRSWRDKLAIWFKPPGWRPADLAALEPPQRFDPARWQRFDPAMRPGLQWFSALQFLALLGGVALFLWHAEAWPLARSALWFVELLAGLWSVGAVMQGACCRWRPWSSKPGRCRWRRPPTAGARTICFSSPRPWCWPSCWWHRPGERVASPARPPFGWDWRWPLRWRATCS